MLQKKKDHHLESHQYPRILSGALNLEVEVSLKHQPNLKKKKNKADESKLSFLLISLQFKGMLHSEMGHV